MNLQPATPTTRRADRILPALTIALLLVLNVLAVTSQIGRRLDHDEAQALHSAWLMDEGKRLYRDFMEDHPPFFLEALEVLRGDSDVIVWTARARVFTAFCGTWAMAAAALIVIRITGNAYAGALTLGALLGARWTWLRGLAEIRADAPSLALFLTGFLLVIWDRKPSWAMAWRIGCGIAIAFAAELVNPKWPLAGLCLGAFFLGQVWRLIRARPSYAIAALVPGIVILAGMYGLIVRATTLDDFLFFTFRLKAQNMEAFESQAWVVASFRKLTPLSHAPPRFAGVLPAALVLLGTAGLALGWKRMNRDTAWRAALVFAMVVAAVLEVRFLHPWPHLWPQFFLLLSFVVAIAYGVITAGVARLVEDSAKGGNAMARAWKLGAIGVALILAVPHLSETIASEIVDEYSAPWPAREQLARSLRPGETVWIGAGRHPITAHDASYLWYSFSDLVPTTLKLIAEGGGAGYLPGETVETLPVCRVASGAARTVRFLEITSYVEYMPGACACAQMVLSRPDVVPTGVAGVYEIVPPNSAPIGPGTPQHWDSFVRSRVARCATR